MPGRNGVSVMVVALCLAGAASHPGPQVRTSRRSDISLALVPMRDRADPLLPSMREQTVDAAVPIEFVYGASTLRSATLWHVAPDGAVRCLFRGVLSPAIAGYGSIPVADGRLGYDFAGEPGRHDFVLVAGSSLPPEESLQRLVARSALSSLAWGEAMSGGSRLSWERVRVVVSD